MAVVWDPQQCSKCKVLHCSKCITEHLKKNNQCPKCREVYDTKNSQVDRILKGILSDFAFKCGACQDLFNYYYAKVHLKKCTVPEFSCPVFTLNKKCDSNKKFRTLVDFRLHLEQECCHVSVSCKKCESNLTRGYVSDHDCISVLKANLKVASETIKEE